MFQIAAPGSSVVSFDLATEEYFGATPGAPATFSVLPEPKTGWLIGLGVLSLALRRRAQGRRRQPARSTPPQSFGRTTASV